MRCDTAIGWISQRAQNDDTATNGRRQPGDLARVLLVGVLSGFEARRLSHVALA